jgi:hypothetical protein
MLYEKRNVLQSKSQWPLLLETQQVNHFDGIHPAVLQLTYNKLYISVKHNNLLYLIMHATCFGNILTIFGH